MDEKVSVTVPESSKYVPGGYSKKRTKNKDRLEEFIEEMIETVEQNPDYFKYEGPISVTDSEGNLIPVPSENKGRYADTEIEGTVVDGKKSKKERDKAKDGKINMYNISGSNRDGILKKGMHIKYLRKNPRNFVKGGFINHINSTYIAFRFARGSCTIQIKDIDIIYVRTKVGKPVGSKTKPKFKVEVKAPKGPRIKVAIKPKKKAATIPTPTHQTGGADDEIINIEETNNDFFIDGTGEQAPSISTNYKQMVDAGQNPASSQYAGSLPYLPKNVRRINIKSKNNKLALATEIKKLEADLDGGRSVSDSDDHSVNDDGAIIPLSASTSSDAVPEYYCDITGREFRDKTAYERFIKSAKYQKILQDKELPHDSRVCCPTCNYRFSNAYGLKRHMNTKAFIEGRCGGKKNT